ncbi:hypothetical protein [Cytobacillus oceanisediminis]|uniref:hypothetical protein n=1 Tax=Cytobacillus oceanisediminis TaxID=665099 RepID=UPI001FB20264|nr:hypothetical protein [Cytobacillus oceanisediminis]UOE58111.1 hypothetical protein IRB79_26750 [Cytobacillus oceanisediminis]
MANKVEIFEQLKSAANDKDIFKAGFECKGLMTELYPNLPEMMKENYYRTWIWENAEGIRVATWDQGNAHCFFMCEGTEEVLLDEYKQQIKEQAGVHND